MRLLLLHSGFGTGGEWRAARRHLDGGFDICAPTLVGSDGAPPLDLRSRSLLEATADHAEQALDERGWAEPVAIAGSSHGAVTALELAARGRATSVVALAPPWLSADTMPFYAALFAGGSLFLRATWPLNRLTSRSRFAGGFVLHGRLFQDTDIEHDDLVAVLQSVRHVSLRDYGRHAWRGRLRPDAAAVRCPVTFVWGTGDRLAPPFMAARWRAEYPGAEFLELPGFPHVPHVHDPARIAGIVARCVSLCPDAAGCASVERRLGAVSRGSARRR